MGLRVAFATCVRLGLVCVEEIYRVGGDVQLLITIDDEQARAKSGRVFLDNLANEHGVPLLKIKNINEPAVLRAIVKHDIDWLFIVGWSQIARREVLEAPARGCIGMHPTLLPKGRGRASIPWAIIKGLKQTGVTMFKIDEGVDSGDIIGQEVIELHPKITATELYDLVSDAHAKLIARYWDEIVEDTLVFYPQDEAKATFWPRRTPADGEILSHMTMAEADRLVRAVTRPYPGAFFRSGNEIIRVWSARVGDNGGPFKLADGYLIPTDFEVERGV